MPKIIFTLFSLLLFMSSYAQQNNIRHVNVFIGTQGTGHTFPGASLPFGMVQPGPDNNDTDWAYTSGYQYKDEHIMGFSQTHLNGTGIGEMGDILILPYASDKGKNTMLKATEAATPGYYTVVKADSVRAELTCSERVAFHRYTFPKQEAKLYINFQHGIRFLSDSLVLDSDIKIENDTTLSGYCHTKNWVERTYFFVIKFDRKFTNYEKLPLAEKENAPKYIMNFTLDHSKQLQVKVALSTVSTKGAKKNLSAEIAHWNFDAIHQKATDTWNKYLNRIDIEADAKKKTLFYTAMYHLLLQPSNIADVDGRYRGADNRIATAASKEYYSTLSNWDVYRAAFPLLAIIAPEKIDAIVNTMLLHHKAAGFLPIWTAWGQDNYCMIANHAIPMIVGASSYGFTGFDKKEALKAIIETSTRDHIHSDWTTLNQYGYYPFDIITDEAISKALENGYDDWCVAYFSRQMGDEASAAFFTKRAQYYKNTFDPETKLFRGKDSKGNWRIPFNPTVATSPLNNPGDYTEATAWQYFWTPAQYDIEGVSQLLGGKAAFTKQLNDFFSIQATNPNKYLGQEAMIGQYAHGNEPNHHIAYLYAYSDEPKKGQKYINHIINEFCNDTPDGMIGNDDCGQMSAWYILSCLGFYPLNPATNQFVFGAPQVTRATLYLANGNELKIEAKNLSDDRIYADKKWFNDQQKSVSISYQDLMKGGKLTFEMSDNSVSNPYIREAAFSGKNDPNVIAEVLPAEAYTRLPFGSIRPAGWIKEQMERDMNGFVGNLDRLVPDLINDPIYSTGRLDKNSKSKELGNLKAGDMEGDDQYKWWNSESQSNWWDGYLRHALLLDNKADKEKVVKQIQAMLATQDQDGYLGIYSSDLRYKFSAENGEFWAKATLYRYLLAYYEASKDADTWTALVRAIDNVMTNYPIDKSDPFNVGTAFSGGVAHGLVFTDVLDRMYQLTGNKAYQKYALFLYKNYSENYSSESDAQLTNVLNHEYRLKCHGVHTYEHIRPLIVASFASNELENSDALNAYLYKIRQTTTKTGGAIGDEWIAERFADATNTGYEYCSLHELMDSYTVLMQKRGDKGLGDLIENIFYNAAMGARHPEQSCIAYLKTDNSYEMNGTRNGQSEAHEQTRYKYSPVHQDVAVCCVPNAGRITPYFLQSAWMKEGESTLVANLLAPTIVETVMNGQKVKIENRTDYPYANSFELSILTSNTFPLKLKIRKPSWAISVTSDIAYTEEGEYLVFERIFSGTQTIHLSFETDVRVIEDDKGAHYFAYGALLFAHPIEAKKIEGRNYTEGFTDLMYEPLNDKRYEFVPNAVATYSEGKVNVYLRNKETNKVENVSLIPLSKTILRQVSF